MDNCIQRYREHAVGATCVFLARCPIPMQYKIVFALKCYVYGNSIIKEHAIALLADCNHNEIDYDDNDDDVYRVAISMEQFYCNISNG